MSNTAPSFNIIDAMYENRSKGGDIVAEVLSPTNFMGGVIPVVTALDATQEYEVQTVFPQSYQRKINNGVAQYPTTPIFRNYSTKEHDDMLAVDRATLKRMEKGGTSFINRWKIKKQKLALMGRFWRVDFNSIYGQSGQTNVTNPFIPDYVIDVDSSQGMIAMMSDLGITGNDFVKDAGGTTAAQKTSAWFLHTGEEFGLHYNTLEGMNFSANWKQETLTGLNSLPLIGEEMWIHGDWGLATSYKYFAFRIKNLTSDSGKGMTYDLWDEMMLKSRLATGKNPDVCVLNPTSWSQFMNDLSTLNLNVEREQDGRNIAILDGVRIIQSNAIMHGEIV